jgi:hypothetical protein
MATVEEQKETSATIAEIISDRSKAGRLIQYDEILAQLRERRLLDPPEDDTEKDFEALIEFALHGNKDLREIRGRAGVPFYYSAESLTETYADILCWKADNPLWLIAQVVRDNSQRYPLPVLTDSFREPPFELTEEEIAECLKGLTEEAEYQDIAQTITSIGTRFLYSTRHLDHDHASMLAEWLDVGQMNNP